MSDFLLHLMRHGAPSLTGRLLGRTDCPATIAGVAACVAQAEGLAFDALVSSDLMRARQSGDVLAATRCIPLTIDARWRELDFGEWDGLATNAIDATALGRFWDDPDIHPPPGGERWSALTKRVSDAIAALAPVPTLVVTHGGAMRAALAVLCEFDQRQVWAFDLPYAALLSVRIWPGTPPSAQIVALGQ